MNKNLSGCVAVLLVFGSIAVSAQNKTLGVGTTTPNTNAALHVESPTNNQGVIIPRLTTAQRSGFTPSLGAGDVGLIVFDTDLRALTIWNGSAWDIGLKAGEPIAAVNPAATGSAGSFTISNAANSSVSIQATTAGTGSAANIAISNPANTSPALLVSTTGTGNAITAGGTVQATAFTGDGAGLTNVAATSISANSIGSANITDGQIADADINATAAIAGTKVNPNFGAQNISTTGTVTATSFTGDGAALTNVTAATVAANGVGTASITDGQIVDVDINAAAAIAGSKIDPNFGGQNILTTGTVTAASFSGDGSGLTNISAAPGANSVGTVTVIDNELTDADVNVAAAIAGTKINPNFGAQNILTTGTVTAASFSGDGSGLTNISAAPGANSVGTATVIDNELTDADVNVAAAIAGTKINPDFGAQNVITTGTITATSFAGDGSALTGIPGFAVPYSQSQADAGPLFVLDNTGTGSAAHFTINNATSVVAAVDANTASANGMAGRFGNSNPGNNSPVVQIDQAGTGNAITTNGTIQAGAFIGDASQLTNTIADSVRAGTVWGDAIVDFTIENKDISNTTSIFGTKILPDFGAQPIITTSSVTAASFSGDGSGLTNLPGLTLPYTNSIDAAGPLFSVTNTNASFGAAAFQSSGSGAYTVEVTSSGFGALTAQNIGTGPAGVFSSTNSSTTLQVVNSSGPAFSADNSGTVGPVAVISMSNASSSTPAVMITTAGTGYALTANAPIQATQFIGDGSLLSGLPGGGDMLASNNLGDVSDISVARTNLGLGTLAQVNEVTSSEIFDNTIINADIDPTAAIDGSKINPDFGGQNISNVADVNTNTLTINEGATITNTTGFALVVDANSTVNTRGVYTTATATGNWSFGVVAEAYGDDIATGVQGVGYGTGNLNYGTQGRAIGAAITNYGLYGDAVNGGTNWAGFFENGDVHITNGLSVGAAGTYGSAGQVLTSQGAGIAPSWANVTPGASSVGSTEITDDAITDADVNFAAAIDGSKIYPDFGTQNVSTTGTVTATSFSGDGSALTGVTASIGASTVGGSEIIDDAITDADINSAASILGTKIYPDFGSQNIVTLGTMSAFSYSGDGSGLTGIVASSLAPSSVTTTEIAEATIVNSDIDANAAIDGTKINPGFGFQNISTSANISGSEINADSEMVVDATGSNAGTETNSLRFGYNASGEAIGSRRQPGPGQYGLDFYTAATNRMTITNTGEVGIGVTTPTAQLDVTSNLAVTSHIENTNGGDGLLVGITGNFGTGIDVSLTDVSNSNEAVYVDHSGLGNGLLVVNSNGSNANSGIEADYSGTGYAIAGTTSSGVAGVAGLNSGTGSAIYGENNGSGYAGQFISNGTGGGALFGISNGGNTESAVTAETAGSGYAGEFTTTGSNSAASFMVTNGSSSAVAVEIATDGIGSALYTSTTGTGGAANFYINNGSNSAVALSASSNGVGGAGSFALTNNGNTNAALYAETAGTGPALLLAQTNSGLAIEVMSGGMKFSVTQISSSTTVPVDAVVVEVTSNSLTVDLPSAAADGQVMHVVNSSVSAGTTTVEGVPLGNGTGKTFVKIAGNWYPL